MKIAKSYSEVDQKEFTFLLLESVKDLDAYAGYNTPIKAKQAVGAWMGFKSQDFKKDFGDWVQHEESTNSIARVLALQANLKGSPTSIVDYCTNSDHLINGIHNAMHRMLLENYIVRVNSRGGYCSITESDLDEFIFVEDINEIQMTNFLLNGHHNESLRINKKIIVIENDNYIPKQLINDFCVLTNVEQSDVQPITGFKLKTILYKPVDYFNLFNEGIKNGLTTILVETTGQDAKQVESLKGVLNKVISQYKDVILTIYIRTYQKDLYVSDNEKIKIVFI